MACRFRDSSAGVRVNLPTDGTLDDVRRGEKAKIKVGSVFVFILDAERLVVRLMNARRTTIASELFFIVTYRMIVAHIERFHHREAVSCRCRLQLLQRCSVLAYASDVGRRPTGVRSTVCMERAGISYNVSQTFTLLALKTYA